MTNIACQLEHSVEAEVSPAFAWNWRTDIQNWDDPPAQFQLDGALRPCRRHTLIKFEPGSARRFLTA
jgi:hypothetical protein